MLFPDRVVGCRTAIKGKPSPEGTVKCVGGYDRLLDLPGLTIRQIEGPDPLEGDTRFMGTLWLASRPGPPPACSPHPTNPSSSNRSMIISAARSASTSTVSIRSSGCSGSSYRPRLPGRRPTSPRSSAS